MLKLLVYILFSIALFCVFSAPWVTSVMYFLNGVLQPKYIWPWTFPDLSVSKYLVLASIAAWGIAVIRKKVDFQVYKQKQSIIMMFMLMMIHLSNYLSDYPKYTVGASTDIIMGTYNTVFVMYFVSIGILSDHANAKKALLGIAMVFGFVGAYYTYWANDLYFSYRWDMFFQGRLIGPILSPYQDGNLLATLVVMCMPFLLLGFFYAKNFWLKWACLGVTPMLWHAIILLGSRGALLSLGLTTLLIVTVLRKHKIVGGVVQKVKGVTFYKGLLLFGLVVALIYQGGILISRTVDTVESAKEESEEPLNPRFVSWGVGIDLIKEHPIFGVGTQRFVVASHILFPERAVHVAHNTFLNFSANSGLPVGICYLALLAMCHSRYRKSAKLKFANSEIYEYISKSVYCSMFGFFICSIFLDLVVFEGFYLGLLLSFLTYNMITKDAASNDKNLVEAR